MPRKIVLVVSDSPLDFSSNTMINLVQSIASNDLTIQVQDFTGTEPAEPSGYQFAEEYPRGSKIFKVFATLPVNATQLQISQTLTAIEKGKLSADPNTQQKPGSEKLDIPNNLTKTNYLIDLGFDGKGEYTGILPVVNIAGAPQWLIDILNTITGHGLFSLIFWMAATTIIGLKISQQKKRSYLLLTLLAISAFMAIDSYRIRQSFSNQNKQV